MIKRCPTQVATASQPCHVWLDLRNKCLLACTGAILGPQALTCLLWAENKGLNLAVNQPWAGAAGARRTAFSASAFLSQALCLSW
jgi:hypothetical protein